MIYSKKECSKNKKILAPVRKDQTYFHRKISKQNERYKKNKMKVHLDNRALSDKQNLKASFTCHEIGARKLFSKTLLWSDIKEKKLYSSFCVYLMKEIFKKIKKIEV